MRFKLFMRKMENEEKEIVSNQKQAWQGMQGGTE